MVLATLSTSPSGPVPIAITMTALLTNPRSRDATVPSAMTALDFSRPPTREPEESAWVASASSAATTVCVLGSTTGMSGKVLAASGRPGSRSLNGLLRSLGSAAYDTNGDADEEYGK